MKYQLRNVLGCTLLLISLGACRTDTRRADVAGAQVRGESEDEHKACDGAAAAMRDEFEKTKDPVTGRVPRELLWPAIEYTDQLKQDMRQSWANAKVATSGWAERGPTSDALGASNGNLRGPNSDVPSGRIRAIMVDASDTSGNTVFAGSVAGGLWKTTSINTSPAGWTLVNDKLSNLAITGICQDPSSTSTMYFCTGEGFFNSDAVQGDGVFKSTNGGSTWSQVSSTNSTNAGTAFNYCTRIICDASGNIYVGTLTGLYRSTNGGTSWTNITPSGTSSGICDVKIAAGRMHVTSGFGSTAYYRYTDNPSTVSSGSGWNSATTPFTTSSIYRVALACVRGNLIALPVSSSTYDVATIYRSTDSGKTWSTLNHTPSFGSGQGWYCMAGAINPADSTQYIVASLDCYKTTNAGTSVWSQISDWASSTQQYVHADQHDMIWYTQGAQSRVLVVCDGGVFLSTDGGSTWANRNVGLRIKQFYSCDIHPSTTNYFLAGAQDNGTHSFSNAGLSTTTEVIGGDGMFVHIDQDQAAYQFTAFPYNSYARSTNSGANWSTSGLNFGSTGRFTNPSDYDNTSNVMYSADATGSYRRWTNPQTGATNDVVSVTALGSATVSAVAVSPYTSNRVYFATSAGILARVDNANTVSSPAAGTSVASSLGTVSSIVFGGSEDTVIVTNSSYSGTQVWYSTNATNASPTFTAKDGNLPNIPVRWSLPIAYTNGKRVMIATETGVWVTSDITAASPTWVADPNFPNVRTDMLKYRSSDKLVAAATHGRGLWTAVAQEATAIALPYNEFVLKANSSSQTTFLTWTFKTARQIIGFDIESADDGSNFKAVAAQQGGATLKDYQYNEPRSSGWKYYRIKSTDQYGLVQYSNIVSVAPAVISALELSNVYPNPAADMVNLTVASPSGQGIRLELYSAIGQKMKETTQQLSAGSQQVSLNMAGIAPGNYLLIAVVGNQRFSYVVVKH
jgi:hypothetical protein